MVASEIASPTIRRLSSSLIPDLDRSLGAAPQVACRQMVVLEIKGLEWLPERNTDPNTVLENARQPKFSRLLTQAQISEAKIVVGVSVVNDQMLAQAYTKAACSRKCRLPEAIAGRTFWSFNARETPVDHSLEEWLGKRRPQHRRAPQRWTCSGYGRFISAEGAAKTRPPCPSLEYGNFRLANLLECLGRFG